MRPMFDFHTHTLLSDGDLIPAESIRRAETAGYRILGISDHSDLATLPVQMPAIIAAARAENASGSAMTVVPGTEVTHVRPSQIGKAIGLARELGAGYVVVHGETVVEPVAPGTNRAAIEAGVDILAHPGLIAREEGALLLFGSDSHTVGDMPTRDLAERLCLAAGLDADEVEAMFARAEQFGLRVAKNMEYRVPRG
jgi:histidinol phosphatase-like PHP family hydrolase